MPWLIFGLLLFIGMHSLRIYAPDWRAAQIARLGAQRWKGIFALAALVSLVLIIIGFAQARLQPVLLYVPLPTLRTLNLLLTLAASVLICAAYVPRNHIKQAVGHPMLAGVILWALGHLLVTGMVHDAVLFVAFLLWASADFITSRWRDWASGTRYPTGTRQGDVQVLVIGIAAWVVVAFWLHRLLIGMSPFA